MILQMQPIDRKMFLNTSLNRNEIEVFVFAAKFTVPISDCLLA